MSPKDARGALERALDRQADRAVDARAQVAEVQLLAQMTPAAEWPKLLAYWLRRNPSGVTTWPRQLAPGSHAMNLWPLPAGRVGHAAALGADVRRRQPKRMLSTPGLLVFDPDEPGTDARSGLAVVCATWLEDIGMSEFKALRLAPPVLEAWATGGRLISREVVDFGLDWPLPAADGIQTQKAVVAAVPVDQPRSRAQAELDADSGARSATAQAVSTTGKRRRTKS